MTMKRKGLETSLWAPRKRTSTSNRSEPRSRSVPPPTPFPAAPSTTTNAQSTTNESRNAIATTNATTSSLSPIQAFHRFEQACQRLRWKYIDLQTSYKRALSPEEWNFSIHDAERNFKVDFHEFYVWIEQALVLVLLIFGIIVSRDGPRGTRSFAAHMYHHNVLKALDEDDNPLHAALGKGDVNHALWKAKELRNRWKDAAEGRETPPLKMYDLTWIVGQILGGLEVAYGMAAARAEEVKMAGNGNGGEGERVDEWEWMVEQMDWEA